MVKVIFGDSARKMASTKSIKTSFLDMRSSVQKFCKENGCGREVFFKFSGCFHDACGSCLSKSLPENPSAYSDVLCPGCTHIKYHKVFYVTYEDFLKKQREINICTSCFAQKAIYRAPCKHLLCEFCLTSIISKPQPCNVQGCAFFYSMDVVKKALENASEMEIWQTFRLTRKPNCQGIGYHSMAVVDIVKCGHALCLSCFEKAPTNKSRGPKQDNKEYQYCCSRSCCNSTYSKSSAQRFMEKIDEIPMMTAANLEIRIDSCEMCGENKKETIRIRKCDYLHTKCVACISSEMEKSNKEDNFWAKVENRQIKCKVNGCENEAPYRCFEALISILKETNLMPDIFIRDACITEKCSRCKGEQINDGFKTILGCSHSLCEICLEEIRVSNTARFYQCEGLGMRCGYHVPRSIISIVLEDTKTQMKENDGLRQSKRQFFANVSETANKEDTQYAAAGKPSPFNDTIVKKTREDTLVAVPEKEKRVRKCDVCDEISVIALLQGCNHCFCGRCLKTFIESSKDAKRSVMSIECPGLECPSFVTVNTVEKFLGDRENSSIPHSDTTKDDIQNPLNLDKPEPVAEKEQVLSKPDAVPIKRKCETEVKTKKRKTLRITKSFGLRNVGLSCYRNTILQTLAETPLFHSMLQKTTKHESPTWIKLLYDILGRIKGEDTGAHDMLEILEQFHYEFNKTNTEYRDFQQEDTLSFLNSVLNGIHSSIKKTELDEKIGDCGDPTSIFKGVFKTAYRCLKCNEEEFFKGETFFSLPLPIAESRSVQGATIGSCFKEFFDEEKIDGVSCSFCESTRMTKAMTVAHFPDILVLQICQLEEATYGRDYKPFQKKVDRVQFWENFSGLKEHTQKMADLKHNLKRYRLFSVVEHLGSASSGHYVCYVRRQNKWWLCDDSYVREVTPKAVKNANAYLLFYEKTDSPV